MDKKLRVRHIDAVAMQADAKRAEQARRAQMTKQANGFSTQVVDMASDVFLAEAALLKALIAQTAAAEGNEFDLDMVDFKLLPNAAIEDDDSHDSPSHQYTKAEVNSVSECSDVLNYYVEQEIDQIDMLIQDLWTEQPKLDSVSTLGQQLAIGARE